MGPSQAQQALKLKEAILTITASAEGLLSQIADIGLFQWADNPQNKGKLEQELTAFRAALTGTQQLYLVMADKKMEQRFGVEQWHREQAKFLDLKPKLQSLEKQVKQMLTMTESIQGSAIQIE